MKSMRKRFNPLLSGGLVLLFSLIAISHAGAQTCVQPPSGLTGWWPGDGNTIDIVGGRDAVLKYNATFGTGQVSQAFILDGTGDYIDVPHDPALNVGTGDFTVDLWVYFNTTDGQQLLVEKYSENFTEKPPGWFLSKIQDNSLRFGTGPDTYVVNSPTLDLPTGTWIHFAARRANNMGTIFVNGEIVAIGQLAYDADSESSLKFGHRGSPDDVPPTPGSEDTRGFFLDGRIDEVELFVGRALTDQEIQDIYNAGADGKCKGTTVQIDIKPGSYPNCFNINGHGVIPVAILGRTDFDVTTIDTDTLIFAGLVVRVRGNKGPLCHAEDVSGDFTNPEGAPDGVLDLVCQFEDDASMWDPGDGEAGLTGKLLDGTPIEGIDSICVRPE